MPDVERLHVLVVRARERVCALPLTEVEEVMRPLPVETMLGAPAGVLGVARIRGAPVPVVDLGALLGGAGAPASVGRRFVTVKQGTKRLALSVEGLVGTRWLPVASLHAPAASDREGVAQAVDRMGALEDQLLFLIRCARLLPANLWGELPAAESGP